MIKQESTMNKNKYQYHAKNVLEAATDRINYIIDNFDDAWYAFSGGKDSLATIMIARDIYKERGLGKPNVFFTDEELIPDDVIDLVKSHAESGDFNFRYFAPTMMNRKFLMGKQEDFCTFSPDRKWVREPPEYAIRLDAHNMTQWQINEAYFSEYKDTGKHVAIVLGIRAEESLMRLSSVSIISKDGSPNWVAKPKNKSFLFYNVKPIYDWSEIDIFKYFFEQGIKYANIYNYQIWCKVPLRVSTPLHEMSSHQLPKLKQMFPMFYAQLVSVFPDVEAHCRYWKDFDKKDVIQKYPHSFDGIRMFIRERYAGDQMAIDKTTAYVDECEALRLGQKSKGINKAICFGFPVMWVFEQVVKGKWGKHGTCQIKAGDFKYEYREYEYDY